MATDHVAFVPVPRFSLLALSASVEALRAANAVSGHPLYRWSLVAPAPGRVASSSGLALDAGALADAGDAAVVAVCGGDRSHTYANRELQRWLRGVARRGATVGALSDASYVVADAGLFDDVRSTIHWHCLDSYRERFPRLDIRASVLELDRRRFSCAGGTSALDLMLTLIQQRHGQDLAAAVADNFIHDHIREAGSTQISAVFQLRRHSRRLAEAARLMTDHIESPLPVRDIARHVDLSGRQLDRLFQQHLGVAPSRYYRGLRLERARHLLIQTGLPIAEIAAATGFASSAHLARCFRQTHGDSPRAYRLASRAP